MPTFKTLGSAAGASVAAGAAGCSGGWVGSGTGAQPVNRTPAISTTIARWPKLFFILLLLLFDFIACLEFGPINAADKQRG
jgi:hypothetical protein